MADDREIISQQKHSFSNNCQKLKLASTHDTEIAPQELNKVLDDLNALDYHVTFVEATEVQDILTTVVNLVPCGNDHLLSKFCHFLSNVVYKQQVFLETNHLHKLVGFIIESVHSCGSWVLTDVLSALAVLLYENVGRLEKFWDTLVGASGILLQLASTNQKDVDIQHAAFKCLQSLTVRKPGETCLGDVYVENCFKLFLSVLQEHWSSAIEDVALCKVLVSNLRCLQNVFTWHSVPSLHLGDLLGTLKVFMYFGLPGQGSLIPRSLYPTPLCQYIPQVQQQSKEDVALYSRVTNHNRRSRRRVRSRKKQTKGKKDTKGEKTEDDDDDDHGNISDSGYTSHQRTFSSHSYARHNMSSTLTPVWLKNSSSESEYSDTEGGHVAKLRSLQLNVRHCAFGTLQTVVKATEKKIIFGYWSSFLPDSPGSGNGPQNQTILTSILKDPSPLVRASALALLAEFLRGSKQFLALAEDRSSPHTAFTPLSVTMASTVRELHRCLLLVLVAESSSSLLTQLLKCCATLVENSPYHRLHSDLLTRLIKHVRPYLTHRDFQVQVACLTVLGCVVSVQPMPKEVVELLLEDSSGKPADTLIQAVAKLSSDGDIDNFSNSETLPWLVRVCLRNVLGVNLPPLPVRLESLQLLGLFVGRYFNAMRDHLLLLEETVVFCLQDSDPFLKLHGAKLLEVTGRCIQNDITMQKAVDDNGENVVTVDVAFGLWQKVLNGALPPCLQNHANPTLRAVSCDCLSTITAPVFHKLSTFQHIMCITILLGLARDEDSSVRGAAVRCLGVYTLFPCLREDIGFLMDVGDVLVLAVEDSNFSVRSKASWALGNLSDALLLNRNEWPEFSSEVSNTFLYTLGMASVKASQDCDRTRANAMRALGNLLHYLPKESLEKEQIQELACQGVQSLLTALGAPVMKVRWNACYALGNLLKNVSLIYSKVVSLEYIFTGLLSALKDCTNFKVRINAALALSLLPTRDLYGNYFNSVWENVISAMDTTNDSVDFKELKHQQNFCDQICASLCHLIALLQPEDLSCISHVTLSSGELLISLMKKYGEGNSSDKMLLVTTAANHVLLLPQSRCLSDEESQLLQLLLEALDQAKEAQE